MALSVLGVVGVSVCERSLMLTGFAPRRPGGAVLVGVCVSLLYVCCVCSSGVVCVSLGVGVSIDVSVGVWVGISVSLSGIVCVSVFVVSSYMSAPI